MAQKNNQEFAATTLIHQIRVSALADQTDAQLLARFVADADGAAFASLVRRHGGLVLQVCRRLLPNHQDAEDAFQATFLALALKARKLNQEGSLRNWLWGVAFRTAKKIQTKVARRKKITGGAMPMDKIPDPNGLPESRLLLREFRQTLEAEIARLPEKCRDAFVLCYQLERSREEAANILDCSVATLQRRLQKARLLLQRRLGSRCAREGIPLTTVFAASALLDGEIAAAPTCLVTQTVQTVMVYMSGSAGKGTVPAGIVALANAACGDKGIGFLQVVGVILLGMASTGAWATLVMSHPGQAIDQPAPAPTLTPAPPPRPTLSKTDLSPATVPDVREEILRDQVAPKVLATLTRVGGRPRLQKTWIDKDTRVAHLVASWYVEPLKEANVHIKYDIPRGQWGFWTDLYNGQMRKIDPQKPIILIQMPGWEYAVKVPAMAEIEEAFRVLKLEKKDH